MSNATKKNTKLDDLAMQLTPEPGDKLAKERVEPDFAIPDADDFGQEAELDVAASDPVADEPVFDEPVIDEPTPEEPILETSDAQAATSDFIEPELGEEVYPEEETQTDDPFVTGDYEVPLHDRPVPRISIQAFCLNPDRGVVLQRAATDRRLSRAHISVHMGGASGAAEFFGAAPTPNLLIIEVDGGFDEIQDQLELLSQVCDPGTKVIVIGQVNDIQLYRELIRQGISEYLVAPLTVPQVIDSITGLFIDPEQPAIGRNIVFTGAKGGVGSSTIAHNASWFISERMLEDVTMVDLDLPFGTAGLDFNHDPAQGVADALTQPDRLDDQLLERLLVKCTDRLSLFTAPGTLDRDFELHTDAFESVLDVVRQTVPCMVIDLPHIWESWTRRILMTADEVVITATPDLASLRNAKNMIDLLRQARPNDEPPRLVLNQVGVPKRPEIPVKEFAEALSLDPALVLPFDPQLFGTASNNGQMIGELKPDSKSAAGLQQLASLLVEKEAIDIKKSPVKKFFDQLMGRE